MCASARATRSMAKAISWNQRSTLSAHTHTRARVRVHTPHTHTPANSNVKQFRFILSASVEIEMISLEKLVSVWFQPYRFCVFPLSSVQTVRRRFQAIATRQAMRMYNKSAIFESVCVESMTSLVRCPVHMNFGATLRRVAERWRSPHTHYREEDRIL